MSIPEHAPTVRDVAARAGVSKSLAALALRGDTGVSAGRRAAVESAARDLGYVPNRAARTLGQRRSGTVGVLLNDLRNPWFVDLLAGLTATLGTVGLAPVLVDSATTQRVGGSPVAMLLQQQVDGIVVVGTSENGDALAQAAASVPVVLAGTYEPGGLGCDVVVNDDDAGASLATHHLLDLGHAATAHLAGPGAVGAIRAEAYRAAVLGRGLVPQVLAGGATEESGYAAARRVLDGPTAPTAIFAYNDLSAIGALSAADDLGLRVPEDVSLVGYDNTYLSGIRHLSLTTIDNGTFAIGVQAARWVADRISGEDAPGRTHRVPVTLQVRRTTAMAATERPKHP